MKVIESRFGLTLMEMIVVLGVIGLLVFFGLPATRMVLYSFENESGTRSMIQAALSSARAIATREHRYAGVRFQRAYQENGKGSQYMIFIISDTPQNMTDPEDWPATKQDLVLSFVRAVKNRKPIKLPESVGVMDMLVGSVGDTPLLDSDMAASDISDAMSFSILFTPTGKLVQCRVRVRNRDGYSGSNTNNMNSEDDVFNTEVKIADAVDPAGMFVQDDYPALGLTEERGRNSFAIYDRRLFDNMNNAQRVDYLVGLKKVYINAYTGGFITYK